MLGSDGETACALLAGNGESGVLNPSDIFHTACPQMEKSEPARLTYNLEYLRSSLSDGRAKLRDCMSVILIFLTLVVLIIFFYREVILALIALLGFLSARTDFLERCVQGVRKSLASPPLSLGGALVLAGLFAFVLLTSEWFLRAGWLDSRRVEATGQRRPPALFSVLFRRH